MTLSMPATFKISVSGESVSSACTRLKARKHAVLVDEPKSRGGTDIAATPLETMLSSFLACTNVIANMVALEMGIEIDSLDLSLTADFDTRGAFDTAEVKVPFPRIEMTVVIDTSASEDEIAALKDAVARRCPVSVILREAGSQIEDVWIAAH